MSAVLRTMFVGVVYLIVLCQANGASETTQITEPRKDSHGIWQLSDDQFDPFLESHETVAVLFTRPDDLYSYAGKYHFDRAAHILRDLRNSSTQFAVLEGDGDSSAVHAEFGIEFYPTMKYCHHDYLSPTLTRLRNASDSDAASTADTEAAKQWEIRCLDFNHHVVELMVVRWVEGLNRQCSLLIANEEQLDEAKQNNEILFVGFFHSYQDVEFALFEDLCKQYKWERDIWAYEPAFAVVFDQEFANKASEEVPGVTVFCQFKEHAWIFNGPLTDRAALRAFMETERYPYFTQITAFNFKQYTEELDLPLLWIAIDDQYESYVEKVGRFYEAIGVEYKGYVSVVWISSRAYMGHIRKLGFPFVPGAMYVDGRTGYKQLYDPQASILNEEKIKAFIESCLDGTGEPYIKSQDEDEIQAAINNDREAMQKDNILIQHVTGNELYQMLEKDEAKYGKYNVVVFYYAPWDERCQRFHGVYEHVAEMLLDENGKPLHEDLLLVKMDATENDPPIAISQYPRIVLYKNEVWPKTSSGRNQAVYSRKREEKRFISWIEQQCGYQPAPTEETMSVEVDADASQQNQENADGDLEEAEPFEYL
eukprot:CAMPEP_0197041850 /NCGR_PEP_ID=MMETSP1384-20130603/18327_1 /TAXON_ID=29189 /ORGANISM="Ammonia sp." /LENGTH=593 /DNA_ID=CAMNT_0042472843 /DNA_START=25 /DNA_END=1806 /DNA_ORIENTATION=-